ncbi:MAG TPA: hypothetical protein VK658_18335 [Chryseolinea sp.]|nr:hypothetical protein [Chryseolinea sp.]
MHAQSKYALGTFASWPVGSFGSTAADDGSFAQPGWGLSFEDEARFKSWPRIFSLGLHLSYQQNAIDHQAMARAFSAALNKRTETTEAKYRPLLVTLGPFFDIPVTEKFDIGIKTGIGFAIANIDSFQLSVYNNPNEAPAIYGLDFKSSPSFTFLLGLNGELRISRVIGLSVFADFSGARSQVESFVGTAARVQSHYDLSFVNTGLGIAVIFE